MRDFFHVLLCIVRVAHDTYIIHSKNRKHDGKYRNNTSVFYQIPNHAKLEQKDNPLVL